MRRSAIFIIAAALLASACEAPTAPIRSPKRVQLDGGPLAGSGSVVPVIPPGSTPMTSASTANVEADTTRRGGPLAGSGS